MGYIYLPTCNFLHIGVQLEVTSFILSGTILKTAICRSLTSKIVMRKLASKIGMIPQKLEWLASLYKVKVRVHQGSILSPLLFIIVLEALSHEFRAGVPWEDLYADDLVIIADSLEKCVRRLLIWKEAMEKKGLRVKAGKTNVMICVTGLDLLQSSAEYPCAVCPTGVGNNSIYCNGCKLCVHKKCSGLQGLTPNPTI